MAPTLADLDARSKHWPLVGRVGYLTVKWSLVSLGAYLLVGHYLTTWGVAAGLWFLIAPALYGVYLGLTERRPGQP